jgi:hypothetical protein
MAAQQAKVLRIGVIQGGKIVEERVLPGRVPVTIGSAPRNTIVVPQSELAASVPVFSIHGDKYQLHFADGAEGRVQSGQGAAAELDALIAQGAARQQGNAFVLPVRDDQRGKLVLGDVTVLWQFVLPPPEAPKTVLPREAKGNHFRSMDRLFVTLLVVSIAMHVGGYLALAQVKLPDEVTLEELPARVAQVLMPQKPPEQPKSEVKTEARAEAKAEEKKESAGDEKKESTEQVAARKAARAAAVAKAVQSKGILKVLGALGSSGSGDSAVADVFGSGSGASDVASALSGAGGVAVATDPGAGGGRKGGGLGGKASIGDLATSGGGAVAYGQKTEVKVSGTVQADGDVEVESDEIDQQKLASFVRARMGLIKACYENALKRNPNLKGKITIRFTILGTGGLQDITAAVNSMGAPDVASCIIGTMKGWRTQFRPTGPVTVEYPFVFSPVN